MVAKAWRAFVDWLAPRRGWIKRGWYEFHRYGASPFDNHYTWAYHDGEGRWWQYDGALWRRFERDQWNRLSS